jgi:peptidoglycan hydrolase-like protein with peptidoglycan-binding domain
MAATARKRTDSQVASARNGSMSDSERVAVQFDLAWTGDYTAPITGTAEDNEKTLAAIKSFQRNRKFKETGVLNSQERALLSSAAKVKQVQVGWTIVEDASTGARLGIPAKQVPIKMRGKAGTRWSSAQGQVVIETYKVREPGTTLATVYEQQRKEPGTRRTESNVQRSDFFVLSGMQGLKRFYVRGDFKDGEVRGVTVLYDQATENIMDPAAVVIASSFSGFAGSGLLAQISPSPRRKVEYGTGIVVSASGHVLTDRQLTQGCNAILVTGHGDADRVSEETTAELALLRVYGARALVPAGFSAELFREAELTVLGIADPQGQGGGAAISSFAAKLKGDLLEPAPPPGFAGAAALDANGQIYGMVEWKTPDGVGAGAAPQATIVTAPAIRAFLKAQQLPALSAAAASAKDSLVRVICVRR